MILKQHLSKQNCLFRAKEGEFISRTDLHVHSIEKFAVIRRRATIVALARSGRNTEIETRKIAFFIYGSEEARGKMEEGGKEKNEKEE